MTQTEQQFEQLISEVIDRTYGVCDNFLDDHLLAGLKKNLYNYHDEGSMHPAGIGRRFDFKENLKVRGDVIRWIEEDSKDEFEALFMEKIKKLIHYLNSTCYTRINHFEFHYAWYDPGSFYKRHLDQFKSNRGRKFSLVIYLNDNWQQTDAGNLRLYLDGHDIDLFPVGNRAVFFKSDEVEHEVMPSPIRPRISIAGWLKSI